MARTQEYGSLQFVDEKVEPVKKVVETIVAREGLSSGEMEWDRLQRERQEGK
jgi:hypothetical protein